MTEPHITRTRVRFAETDLMGVVYHAHYLSYFEIGRTELIRELGQPYSELEARGVRLVVTDATLRYRAPARYDDPLRIETTITSATTVRIHFAYRCIREATEDVGEYVAAEGTTTLASISHDGRPRRLPDELRRAFAAALERSEP